MTKTQAYRTFMAVLGILGVSIQFYQSGPGMLLYYTVLSNILVFSSFLYFVYYETKRGSINQSKSPLRYKGGVTLAIALTFLVYHFLLGPKVKPADFWSLHNLLVHYLAPIGLIVDTLFLDAKGPYQKRDPFIWTLFPICYCICSLINGLTLALEIPGSTSSPFPYFFLDLGDLGWSGVLSYILVISVLYILLGYGLYAIKGLLGPKKSRHTT